MSIRTTKVDFYLVNPDGSPVTNTSFFVKPLRASFMSEYAGLSLDIELKLKTDSTGHVLADLVALPYPYVLIYDDSDDSNPGQFLFYVPAVDFTVNFQDLIVTRADSQDKYVDNALNQIVSGLAKAKEYAEEAKASAEAAKLSETNAGADEAAVAEQASQTADLINKASSILSQVNDTYAAFTKDYASVITAAGVLQSSVLTGAIQLGNYFIWVDPQGLLRINAGSPPTPTSGEVVGDQSST